MEPKQPEEITLKLKDLLKNWQKLGHGREIIQYQKQINKKWKVITLRCVNFSTNPPTLCHWYLEKSSNGPDENLTSEINKILEKANYE